MVPALERPLLSLQQENPSAFSKQSQTVQMGLKLLSRTSKVKDTEICQHTHTFINQLPVKSERLRYQRLFTQCAKSPRVISEKQHLFPKIFLTLLEFRIPMWEWNILLGSFSLFFIEISDLRHSWRFLSLLVLKYNTKRNYTWIRFPSWVKFTQSDILLISYCCYSYIYTWYKPSHSV